MTGNGPVDHHSCEMGCNSCNINMWAIVPVKSTSAISACFCHWQIFFYFYFNFPWICPGWLRIFTDTPFPFILVNTFQFWLDWNISVDLNIPYYAHFQVHTFNFGCLQDNVYMLSWNILSIASEPLFTLWPHPHYCIDVCTMIVLQFNEFVLYQTTNETRIRLPGCSVSAFVDLQSFLMDR